MKLPVPETEAKRRLDPIDQALVANQPKQAIKLCNHALSKRPGWPAARALKACALVKQNSREAALAVVDEIIADIEANRVPLDADACDKITLAFRDLRLPDRAAAIKEKLWLRDMSVVEHGEAAYSCFICAHMFEEARRTALRLMRLKTWKTVPYTVLMGCAVWLDVQMKLNCSDPNTVDKRMLKVASMQIAKVVLEKEVPQRETVHFAARLFVDAGMFEQAKTLLEKAEKVMGDKENLVLLGSVQRSAGQLDEAAKYYRKIVAKVEADDWQCWAHYMDCVGDNGKEELWETLVTSCELAEKHSTPMRAPFIAKMEILLREGRSEELRDDIVSFFGVFSTRPRCKLDLRKYVAYLKQLDVLDNLFDLLKVAVEEANSVTSHVNLCWLKLWCGCLDESVEQLAGRYNAEKERSGTSSDGDDYLILVAHKLLQLGEDRYKDKRKVLQAIVLLEHGFGRSVRARQLQLLMIMLYTRIGYTERAYAMWLSLDVKAIQAPTLAYLVLDPLFGMANYDDLHSLFLLFTAYWYQVDTDLPKAINVGLGNAKFNATANLVLFRHRQARHAVLAKALLVQALVEVGRGEGVEGAWKLVAEGSRFPCGEKEWREGLTHVSDKTVVDFWNGVEEVEVEVDEHDETAAELGQLVPKNVQSTIFESLKAMKSVLGVAKGFVGEQTQAVGEDVLKANSSNVTVNEEDRPNGEIIEASVSPGEVDRAAFLQSFTRVLGKLAQVLSKSGKSTGEPNGNVADEMGACTKQVASLCKYIWDQVTAIESGLKDVEGKDYLEKVPMNLSECGNFVGVVLVLVAVGVEGVSARMGQKTKGKKSGGVDSVTIEAEKLVKTLKQAAVDACERVVKVLNALVDVEHVEGIMKWADVPTLVPYLPEKLRLVRVGDEGDIDLGHEEYVGNLVRNVVASHVNAAKRMVALVDDMKQKLK